MTVPVGGRVRRAARRTGRVLRLVLVFAGIFLEANAYVLREIVSLPVGPLRSRARPAVVALPLRCRTTLETVSLANLITLTPGTLTVEVATDPPTLYVHAMFADDPERVLAQLRWLEDRLLAALRPVADSAADHAAGHGEAGRS